MMNVLSPNSHHRHFNRFPLMDEASGRGGGGVTSMLPPPSKRLKVEKIEAAPAATPKSQERSDRAEAAGVLADLFQAAPSSSSTITTRVSTKNNAMAACATAAAATAITLPTATAASSKSVLACRPKGLSFPPPSCGGNNSLDKQRSCASWTSSLSSSSQSKRAGEFSRTKDQASTDGPANKSGGGNGKEPEWTSFDDRSLRFSVIKHGSENWCKIAETLKRSQEECIQRWMVLSSTRSNVQLLQNGGASNASSSCGSGDHNDTGIHQQSSAVHDDDNRCPEKIPSSASEDSQETSEDGYYRDSSCASSTFFSSHQILDEYDRTNEKGEKKGTAAPSRKKRNTWSKEEDARLMDMIFKDGPINWHEKAQRMPGRTGKACRDRWINQLDPKIADRKDAPWTAQEDRQILFFLRKYGTKWSALKDRLPGRTELKIKNRWNSTMRRRYIKYLSLRDDLDPDRVRLLTEDGRLHPLVDMEEMLSVARNKNIVTTERRKAAGRLRRVNNSGLVSAAAATVAARAAAGGPPPPPSGTDAPPPPVERVQPPQSVNETGARPYSAIVQGCGDEGGNEPGKLLSPTAAKSRPYSALMVASNRVVLRGPNPPPPYFAAVTAPSAYDPRPPPTRDPLSSRHCGGGVLLESPKANHNARPQIVVAHHPHAYRQVRAFAIPGGHRGGNDRRVVSEGVCENEAPDSLVAKTEIAATSSLSSERLYCKIKKQSQQEGVKNGEESSAVAASTIGFILLSRESTFADARVAIERDLDGDLLPAVGWKFFHSTLGPVGRKQEAALGLLLHDSPSSGCTGSTGTPECPLEILLISAGGESNDGTSTSNHSNSN